MPKVTGKIKEIMSFEDAVSLTGYGYFNIFLLIASGLCLMIVIIETMGMMFVIPAAQCDLDLSLSQKSILSAISFLGVVSSSHLWGFLADTRGRKNVLFISMIMSFLTSVISSLIPQAWLFILIRFINGFFVGGSSAVVYAYVGEFHDKTYRPKVVTWIATFVALGNMILPGLGWIILPETWKIPITILGIYFRPWRFLIIVYSLPSVLAALFIYLLPESPKYLLTEGKNDDALNILKKVYSFNTGKHPDDFPVKEVFWEEDGAENISKKHGLLKTMWKQTVPLFKRHFIAKTVMVCLLQFGAFASSSGLLMWYPEVLNRMTLYQSLKNNFTVCEAFTFFNEKNLNNTTEELNEESFCQDSVNDDVFIVTLAVGGTFAILYILMGTFINVIGNRNILLIFFVLTTITGLTSQYIESTTISQLLMGIFLTVGTTIGVINTIVVELFPTQLRAMALAISLMAGRFGAVTGSNLTGPLLYNFCDYIFYIYAIDHIVLIVILMLLPRPSNKPKMITPLE